MVFQSQTSFVSTIDFLKSKCINFSIVNLNVFVLILAFYIPSSLNHHIYVKPINATIT